MTTSASARWLPLAAVLVASCAGTPPVDLPAGEPYVRGPIESITQRATASNLLVRGGPGSREPCGISATVDARTSYLIREASGAVRQGTLADLAPGDTVEVHVEGPVAESCPVQGFASTIVLVGRGAGADSTLAKMGWCENPDGGYTVLYPAAWHVHDGEVVGACSLFHPEPFEVPPFSELPMEIAIAISVQPIPFDSMLSGDRGRRDLSREPMRVDGREAVRIDSETTGEGLYDAGIRYYQYLVNVGDGTLIATTYDAGAPAFERRRAVLDAMMSTLRFSRVRLIIARP